MTAPTEPSGVRQRGLPIAEAIGTRRLVIAIVTMPIIAVLAVTLIILYAKSRPRPAPVAVDAPLTLPAGGRIVETETNGRRLIVRIETADGGGAIVVYDIETGRLLRTIDMRAAATVD
ncbi:MAG: hypothetical protein K2Q06_04980 [Parvularculaceae bacterium]|nr:hypothetical protein [Parvularculaceae bacterium]